MPAYLIRHTAPANCTGLCYGQTDLPLAASFRTELAAAQKKLPASFQYVFSSPLQRCSKLAMSLQTACPVVLLDNLKELDFGLWEMRLWSQIPVKDSIEWTSDFVNNAPPCGETFSQLSDRAMQVWVQHILPNIGAHVAAVTHAGVIRAIVAHLTGLEMCRAFDIDVAYGDVFRIDKEGSCYKVQKLQ
jgi:alpha-ribazole phosphatase